MSIFINSLVIMLLFASSTTTNQNINSWSELNLKGRVKTLHEVYARPKIIGKNYESEGYKDSTVYFFNKTGNIIEQRNFDANASLTRRTVFEYGLGEKIVKTTTFYSNQSNYTVASYSYDDNNRLIEVVGINNDGKFNGKSTYLYDENGNNIEEKIYKSDGIGYSKLIYSYDLKGRKIEEKKYYTEEKLKWIYSWKHDVNDKIVESVICDANGIVNSRETNQYDEHGNCIEISTFKADDNILKKKKTFRYEFDASLNWIKQTLFLNDSQISVTERKIEYF
ncbi:MAG: hypothetical protein IPQ02_02380 [Saprospiraceae bacterium]|nr:hypothetical protein [Candidatus Defluviibacterium haderslevense]